MFRLHPGKPPRSFSPTRGKKGNIRKDLLVSVVKGGSNIRHADLAFPPMLVESKNVVEAASRDDGESSSSSSQDFFSSGRLSLSSSLSAASPSTRRRRAVSAGSKEEMENAVKAKDATLVASMLTKGRQDLRQQIANMSRKIQMEEEENDLLQKSSSDTLEKLHGYSRVLHNYNQDLSERCQTLQKKIRQIREENEILERKNDDEGDDEDEETRSDVLGDESTYSFNGNDSTLSFVEESQQEV